MVTIGADLHKRSHTVVAVDGTGRKLAERTVAATPTGHLELRRWARRWRQLGAGGLPSPVSTPRSGSPARR